MMEFDALQYRYSSRRTVVYARRGMVATGQPLAAQAGLEILQKGGNAVDAAIAAAAALTVTEPTSNGIGGDCFAIVWDGKALHGLNASGPAPSALSIQVLNSMGLHEMPRFGPLPVTVPGAPAGWAALSRRFGRLPLAEVLAPAIRHAMDGFPVSPTTALHWKRACGIYEKARSSALGHVLDPWFAVFAPGGRAPGPGELWRSPDHARTLRLIGETEARDFYEGEIASRIEAFMKEASGFLSRKDLEDYRVEWVEPLRIRYRQYEICELPPNGQGIVVLMTMNLLKEFEFDSSDSVRTFHHQIEAIKLAFADALAHVADPSAMKLPVETLLSDSYCAERRALIGTQALEPLAGSPPSGGTVYLAAADAEGMMVSFIQSNYTGFGSGLVVPQTGIALHNRGLNFSLDPEHPNALAPQKRPYHTIIPGFLMRDGMAVGPFGVMGAFMQPQGHVQVLMRCIDFHENPQEALDAPRWQWISGKKVQIEPGFPREAARQLSEMGHDIEVQPDSSAMGRGQIIWRDEQGVLCGATEPRTDGCVAAY